MPTQDEEIKVYTVQEIVKILKVSQNTVLAMLKDGRLQGVKIGRFWRVSEKNLKAFINGEKV